MGFTTYVFLLFGVTIALWLAGFQSPLFALMGCPDVPGTSCATNPDLVTTVVNSIVSSLSNPSVLIAIPIAIITSLVLGGSFALMFVIPLLIGMVLINMFLFPTQLVLGMGGMPWELNLIIGGFLNLLLVLTIISFVRGGD